MTRRWAGRDQSAYTLGLIVGMPLGAALYATGGWLWVGVGVAAFAIFWAHDVWAKRGPYKKG